MIVNGATLRTLYTGFSAAFQGGLGSVQPQWGAVAMEVPSSTRSNEYAWLGEMPRIREWIGERVVQNIGTYGYTIRNRPWELTIGVDRDDIRDDNLGLYAPLFTNMGRVTGTFPDELVWPLLAAGFTTPCYDGQYFFDVDHPVLDATGTAYSVSNFGGGTETAWYLIDDMTPFKPLIWQNRQAFEFVHMDAPTDEVVFNLKKYRYGVDGRGNAGYGFWQVAYGSKQPLDAANYEAARVALANMRGDYGRPLGLRGSLLVVPPTLEGAALELLVSERTAAGATNKWRGSAKPLVASWLAS